MKREELKKYYIDAKPIPMDDEIIERLRPLVDAEGEWTGDVSLTREEAAYDIDCFFDLLKYCYAGYNYYADKIDFAQAKADVLAALPETGITAVGVKDAIYYTLKPHINDTHFGFECGGWNSFQKSCNAWFTGLTVEECEDGYKVIRKETGDVNVGHIFTAEETDGHRFETFPNANGAKRYYIGVLSSDKPETLEIGGFTLPLHLCRLTSFREAKGEAAWSQWTWNSLQLVKHVSYGNSEVKLTREAFQLTEDADPFREFGEKMSKEPVFMWSLLGNSGGNSVYPQAFVEALNAHAAWESDCAILDNPLLDKEKTEKVSECHVYSGETIDHTKAKYEGRVFVFQNKGVASSAEAAISYARSLKNVCFVGTSTAGCGQFGDLRKYRLPNSGIYFVMGYKVFNENGFEEGVGFMPDYWLDVSDVWGVCDETETFIKMMHYDLRPEDWGIQLKNHISDDVERLVRDIKDYATRADLSEEKKAELLRLGERIRADVEAAME